MLFHRVIAVLSLLIILPASSIIAKNNLSDNLKPGEVVLVKHGEIISRNARSYFDASESDFVTAWVFFTDKSVFNKSEFQMQASKIKLSDKVLKRRAKTGTDEILFVDLPVDGKYIKTIESFGGTLRQQSRWLNAASYEIPKNKLEDISRLPFVYEIRPVAKFEKPELENEIAVDLKSASPDLAVSPDALNYGNSYTQLNQANIIPAHVKGLTGQGVTLAIMDTGFRKSHMAFAKHYQEGRVIAERDFIYSDNNTANEEDDVDDQWNHGTYIWSVSGGEHDGKIYGGAYKANFILCKTEDLRSETPLEEDNWVAALEWSDSLGADVITTSLGYSDWYTQSDFDGNTATITLAANTCASLGIVACNSMGNSGPNPTTLTPPADAHDILAIGAVNSSGTIAGFSSRGPTYHINPDSARIKPEVCAMGVSTTAAYAGSDGGYSYVSGTSLSTPVVAGAVCLLIEAQPNFPPQLIRQALMETAHQADNPDNTYGWGIINLDAALSWGVNMDADQKIGDAPLAVQFEGTSALSPSSWSWDFGDGNFSSEQNPQHVYLASGMYSVSLTIQTQYGEINKYEYGMIAALGDTITYAADSSFAGSPMAMSIILQNSQPLNEIYVPFKFDPNSGMTFDSVSRGLRTESIGNVTLRYLDTWFNRYTYRFLADPSGPLLEPGTGEVMKLWFTVNEWSYGGQNYPIDTFTANFPLRLSSPTYDYDPIYVAGEFNTYEVIRGDVDNSKVLDIDDIIYMIEYMFGLGPAPVCKQVIDANDDHQVDIDDVVDLVEYMFGDGPSLPFP